VTQVIATLRPAPTRILDIGCGTGALLRLLAGRFPRADLIGADASKEMLKMASRANPFPERLRFIEAQAEGLPFAESSFDLILSTISFHHWADQSRGLREAARTLTPGGLFLLADHFVTPLQWVFSATPGRRKRFHTPAEIDEMLGVAGLTGHRWHDIHRIGPFLLINGVTAGKAPVGSAPVGSAPIGTAPV
jgi:SAM-dependent methyltransferase